MHVASPGLYKLLDGSVKWKLWTYFLLHCYEKWWLYPKSEFKKKFDMLLPPPVFSKPHVLFDLSATTKYHRPGRLNNKKLFSLCFGGYNSEFRMPEWWGSGEDSLPGSRVVDLLLHPRRMEREWVSSLIPLLIRAVIHHEGSTLKNSPTLITFQRTYLQISPHWGLWLWYMD